jgi:3,4-dihydroxy 2-butanone 4-phosphate synthase/GTP cyclohydrolase II
MVLTADPADSILSTIQQGQTQGWRPFVTLAYAQSLDGSLAARRGEPLAISGPASQRLTHQLRASHSAILVGIGTVLADDPQLNVRLVSGKNPQPVILDSHLRTPVSARMFQMQTPWIAATHPVNPGRAAVLEGRGARLLVYPSGQDGRVSLFPLLQHLSELGIQYLMVEGGAGVITSFLRERLVDLLVLTIAPILVGGQPAVEEPQRGETGNFPGLITGGYARLGEDLVVWGRPSWPGGL